MPLARSWATRPANSSRMVLATALPSRTVALMANSSSVEEVAGSGEIHGHPGGLRGRDDLFVTDRTTGLHHGAHPGLGEDLQAVGEREERITRGDRTTHAIPCPGDRQTRSEEHTSELQSRFDLVCRLLLENK